MPQDILCFTNLLCDTHISHADIIEFSRMKCQMQNTTKKNGRTKNLLGLVICWIRFWSSSNWTPMVFQSRLWVFKGIITLEKNQRIFLSSTFYFQCFISRTFFWSLLFYTFSNYFRLFFNSLTPPSASISMHTHYQCVYMCLWARPFPLDWNGFGQNGVALRTFSFLSFG